MLTRREEGFTLIELLVSITVLGIIMIGLVAVMFGAMKADLQTKLRLDETRDQQFAAAFFSTDAQAATTIVNSGTARCGTGNLAVEFQGRSYDPATREPKTTVVSYVFSTATVDGRAAGQLQRQSCEAADPPPGVLAVSSTTVVARNLVATAAPTAVCMPAPCGLSSLSVTLSAARRSSDTPFVLVGTRRTTP